MLPVPLVITVPSASGLATRTTSWTDPLEPAFRLPTLQVTVPAELVPPPVALALKEKFQHQA